MIGDVAIAQSKLLLIIRTTDVRTSFYHFPIVVQCQRVRRGGRPLPAVDDFRSTKDKTMPVTNSTTSDARTSNETGS